ncbi:MAG: hypothetical protein SFY80_12485 [Verrucomicrobiota bacterium]|nr:hypothetical protein [Verrucomicrobiota bacterium]
MYINLIQVAESFGESDKVVVDGICGEGLPPLADRGGLLLAGLDAMQSAGAQVPVAKKPALASW